MSKNINTNNTKCLIKFNLKAQINTLILVGAYSGDSDLQFGQFLLQSQEGAQQGDPLGPLYFCLAIHDLLTSLQEIPLEDLVLLGSPLLAGRGVDTVLSSKRGDLETLASRLPLMPAHDSLFLLRNVRDHATSHVHAGRGQRHARAARKELELYDEVLRSTLSATLNVDLSDEGWQQASLPVRWGDWGFVVLLCWHLLPAWHQPLLALRPWS